MWKGGSASGVLSRRLAERFLGSVASQTARYIRLLLAVMSNSRVKSPFGSAMLNMALVLFLVGVFGVLLITLGLQIEEEKERLELRIVLSEAVSPTKGQNLVAHFEKKPYTKQAEYVSKEEALKRYEDTFDEPIQDVLDGVNPMPASIDIMLNRDYTNLDSTESVVRSIYLEYQLEVKDIVYPMRLIKNVNARKAYLQPIAIGVGVLLLLLAFVVVYHSVKLAIFSRRMLIRSMQLVGASPRFARRPFIRLGMMQGLLGGALAAVLLYLAVFGLNSLITQWTEGTENLDFVVGAWQLYTLLAGLLAFGWLIGWASSYLAVNRYLNRSLDDVA